MPSKPAKKAVKKKKEKAVKKAKPEKKAKAIKEKKGAKVAAVSAGAAGAGQKEKKGGRLKTAAIVVVCGALVVMIVFSIIMLIDSRKDKTAKTDEVSEAPVSEVAEDKGGGGLSGLIAKLPFIGKKDNTDDTGDTADAAEEKVKPPKYSVDFTPGETKAIQDAGDKAAAPSYEVTVHSARELSASDKATLGLSREKGRLAAVDMDIRLLEETSNWDMYHRRIADTKGNWLDEIHASGSSEDLNQGENSNETLVVRLLNDKAEANEKVSLSFYTSSWNGKKKPDGKCDIPVEPAPPPGAAPVIRNVDTEYGNWTGNTYTSSQLDMSLTLPDDWSNRSAALQGGGDSKAIEASVLRADGKASLQLSVDMPEGNVSESDQIDFITNLLSKAIGNYTVSTPFNQTIAGQEYLGLTYSHAEVTYHVYFRKTGDKLVEIALYFPLSEEDQSSEFLSRLKAIS